MGFICVVCVALVYFDCSMAVHYLSIPLLMGIWAASSFSANVNNVAMSPLISVSWCQNDLWKWQTFPTTASVDIQGATEAGTRLRISQLGAGVRSERFRVHPCTDPEQPGWGFSREDWDGAQPWRRDRKTPPGGGTGVWGCEARTVIGRARMRMG